MKVPCVQTMQTISTAWIKGRNFARSVTKSQSFIQPENLRLRQKKKKSCTYSVWESHHPPSQNLLNWNRVVFQLPSWRSEETWWVLHGDREWGLSNKISYFLCVNKSVTIFLNDLSLVLYLRNAAFLMLMCRHADFSTTFITLWTGIQYPPLCQS